MVYRLVGFGSVAILFGAFAAPMPRAAGQGDVPTAPSAAPPSTVQSAASSSVPQPSNVPQSTGAAAQRALVDRYCVGCHNQRGKAAGQEPARKITLDDLAITHVADHGDAWERVGRKIPAGMMAPAGARRADTAFFGRLNTELNSILNHLSQR